jgi:hypothetical protein
MKKQAFANGSLKETVEKPLKLSKNLRGTRKKQKQRS